MTDLSLEEIQHNTQLLIEASYRGDLKTIKQLFPVSDPRIRSFEPLVAAVKLRNIKMLKMLIPLSDPKANNSEALRLACSLEYTDCLKLLIPVSDKKIKDPFWLRFTLLEAAENGRVKLIKNILSLVNHSDVNSNEALARAMAYEHWKCVDLLTPFLKPEYTDDMLIKAAAKNRIKLVKILIPFSTEATSKGWALRAAAENGHLQCVKLLIPVSDPKVKNTGIDGALIDAARNGDMKILKLLIPISDPKIHSKSALQFAAEKGHAECVKLLIPVSDPKLENSLALIRAAINGHTECVKLLFPVSNYNDALARLYKDNQNTTCLQPFIDEYQALKQNERLSNTLTNASAQHKNRKRKL